MNGLAKAYYVWNQPCKGAKGINKIHTKDGREMSLEAWEREASEMINKFHLTDLLERIEEYVQANCIWVKKGELRQYSMNCLLKGTYKKWSGFV